MTSNNHLFNNGNNKKILVRSTKKTNMKHVISFCGNNWRSAITMKKLRHTINSYEYHYLKTAITIEFVQKCTIYFVPRKICIYIYIFIYKCD